MNDSITHPKGEQQDGALIPVSGPVAVDTFGGRIHVEWNPQAAVTPLGQLPFFIEYLKVGGLFEPWVESCPLEWTSPTLVRQLPVETGRFRARLSHNRLIALGWRAARPKKRGDNQFPMF